MAFEPVRLTHPSGTLEDVVVDNAVDLNNHLYRDGYVRAGVVASQSVAKVEAEAPKQESHAERRKREQDEAKAKADANTN